MTSLRKKSQQEEEKVPEPPPAGASDMDKLMHLIQSENVKTTNQNLKIAKNLLQKNEKEKERKRKKEMMQLLGFRLLWLKSSLQLRRFRRRSVTSRKPLMRRSAKD